MVTALYLGRFQPFHLGHLSVVTNASVRYNKVVIGLCSCQKHHTKRNPFTFWERYEMIVNTLKDKGITNYDIIPIPDIECPLRWAEFVKVICTDFDVVLSNNPNTRELFEKAGCEVKNIGIIHSVCATNIREGLWWYPEKRWMWSTEVPNEVFKYIHSNELWKRVQSIGKE